MNWNPFRLDDHNRLGRGAEAQDDFGPNWSREEEEVSLILRNLRGIAGNSADE